MSASDVRRGPGWWMDLEGGWNPPETWPEPTPPLPGWIRTVHGHWAPPDGSNVPAEDDVPPTEAGSAPAETSAGTEPADRIRLGLTYADQSTARPVAYPTGPSVRSAVMASLAAALTVIMIATGAIVLISLL